MFDDLQGLTHYSTASTKTTVSCNRATPSLTRRWCASTYSMTTGKRCSTSTRPTRLNSGKPNWSSSTRLLPFLYLSSNPSLDPISFSWRPLSTGGTCLDFQKLEKNATQDYRSKNESMKNYLISYCRISAYHNQQFY